MYKPLIILTLASELLRNGIQNRNSQEQAVKRLRRVRRVQHSVDSKILRLSESASIGPVLWFPMALPQYNARLLGHRVSSQINQRGVDRKGAQE